MTGTSRPRQKPCRGSEIRSLRAASVNSRALAGLERWHDAVSGDAGLALRIDVEPFFGILEDHFDLALDVLASLAQELLAIRRQSAIE